MFRNIRRITAVLALLLIGAMCVAVALAQANTPPARSSVPIQSRQSNAPSPALSVTPQELWRVQVEAEYVGLPASDDRGVVAGVGDSQVLAVDNEGAVQWRVPVEGVLANRPRIHGDLVFVSTRRGVVALHRSTGDLVWFVPSAAAGEAENRANEPVVAGETVVVTTDSGAVFGLEITTGSARWSLQLPTNSGSEPAAVEGMVIVVGIGEWFGIDAVTGAVAWSSELGLYGTSSPVAFLGPEGPTAAVVSDERLLAVDARTGELRWHADAEQSELSQVPIFDGSRLLIPDHWGRLAAHSTADGSLLWRTKGADTVAEFGQPVWLGGDVVALPLDEGGPRFASPSGATSLRPPSDGHGLAGFGADGLVVSTWGGSTNYLVAYRIRVGGQDS